MPPPPAGQYSPGGAAKRPGTVVAAVTLWVILGVGSALGGIALFVATGNETLRRQVVLQIGTAVTPATLVSLGIVALVVGAAYIVFGVLMLRARNWARIAVTVLGLLALLGLNILTFVLVAVAIVLQFLPSSNAYFTAAKQAR